MKVPLTINDFLDRAATVYPDRVAVVDEPNQPAAPLKTITYREMADIRRQMGVAMDKLGIPMGARVVMVSHNSARLLASFWGVGGNGRIFVPVNFRLSAEEVSYIIDHCGAEALLIDPELEEALADVTCKHKWIIGEESDAVWLGHEGEPEPWTPDEDAIASINYTSGTTARPKGVEQTHRARWINATTFGWHTGVNDRDVYMHTLPMFHCDGWGMGYAVTAMGVKHVVIRSIDGAEILRRVDEHGVTMLCGAPAVVAAVLDAAKDLERRDSRTRQGSHRCRRGTSADSHDRGRRDRTGLGIHPAVWTHRNRSPAHDQPLPVRVGRSHSWGSRQEARPPGRPSTGRQDEGFGDG